MEEVKKKQSETAESLPDSVDPTDPAAACEFGPIWPLQHQRSAALKPLLFPEPAKKDRAHLLRRSHDLPLPCVLCDECFGEDVTKGEVGVWEGARDELLRHLIEEHAIVIHQVAHIASLRRSVVLFCTAHLVISISHSYCQYWRERFSGADISVFCPIIRTNTDPRGQSGHLICMRPSLSCHPPPPMHTHMKTLMVWPDITGCHKQ